MAKYIKSGKPITDWQAERLTKVKAQRETVSYEDLNDYEKRLVAIVSITKDRGLEPRRLTN